MSFSFTDNQIDVLKINKKQILIKVKDLNFSKSKQDNFSAILHNEDFPTLRTTKVEIKKNSLEFNLISDQEIFFNKKMSTIF